LYRGDVAAEMRAALELQRVRPWLESIDAERVRANAGADRAGGI
jgi:hypothetical protein